MTLPNRARATGSTTGIVRRSSADRPPTALGAGQTRWGNAFPRAVASGILKVGPILLPCAVLDNGTRVLTQVALLHAVTYGRARSPRAGTRLTADWVPTFLTVDNLHPYIDDEVLRYSTPIRYRSELGTLSQGYAAMLLPVVCSVYLHAREDDVLTASQLRIAQRASILLRALSNSDILALVDEATGFRDQQAGAELTHLLAEYIAPELVAWTNRFPDEFFAQVCRLEGLPYRPGAIKGPSDIARCVYAYIYERLSPETLDTLRKPQAAIKDRTYRNHAHHLFLEVDTGNPHLDSQIVLVTVLMRISKTKVEFARVFDDTFSTSSSPRPPLAVEPPTDH
jgi:hypothetical protein